ncbi:HYR domain-containing protein, partial [bacterium]|nr:HYR domain-containing protein [bacterium]
PPRARCTNLVVSADSSCVAMASVNNNSDDPDTGDALALNQSPPGPYPVGTNLVTLTAVDSHGASNSCVATVIVQDTTPPVIANLPTLTLQALPGQCEAVFDFLPLVMVWDNCDPNPVLNSWPPAGVSLPVGRTNVLLTASDASGNTSSTKLTVSVYPAGTEVTGLTWAERTAAPEPEVKSWRSVASSATNIVASAVYGGPLPRYWGYARMRTEPGEKRNWEEGAGSAVGAKTSALVFGGRLFTSGDSGESWTPRESTRNWSALASSADGAKLIAAVYGGQLHISEDSGLSWSATESPRAWSAVACSAGGNVMVAAVRGGGVCGFSNTGGARAGGWERGGGG